MPHSLLAPRRLTVERGASFLALVALAIAQPVLDVVANSPEFFVARDTAPSQAVAAVAAICFGVPLLLLALERAISRASPRAGTAFHGLVLAALTAAMVLSWLKRAAPGGPWDLAAAGGAGAVVALAYGRWQAARLFVTVLAAAAAVVPAAFFLDADVRRALAPEPAARLHPQAMARTPPVVFVVFDELPLNSLLDARREIDAIRYPNLAALARDAYWFRNAGTVSSQTVWAVPALLSGRYPLTPHSVPTLRYYPTNLFTLLAGRYEMTTFMPFRQLCPSGACRRDTVSEDSVPALLEDLALVWLHIVLPERLSDGLPPVTENWMGFAQAEEQGGRRPGNFRAAQFARFVRTIEGRPAQLHFLHSLLPHWPLQYAPTGRRYPGPSYSRRREGGERLFLKASAEYADALHQRHLAQVAFVDRLLGELIARLRAVNAYDAALVIVTADHGSSYREGTSRRAAGRNNAWDIIHVPLIVKLPGQRGGYVVDRIVESVDVLPTLIELLSVETGVKLDGRSLLDERRPRTTRTFIQRGRANALRRELDDLSAQSLVSLERKVGRFGDGDPQGLYATPETRHLLGRREAELPVRHGAGAGVLVPQDRLLKSLNLEQDRLPLYVGGTVAGSARPPVLVAVLVNGAVAAVTRSFREGDDHVFGTLIPEERLRSGNNDVAAVVLDEERARVP